MSSDRASRQMRLTMTLLLGLIAIGALCVRVAAIAEPLGIDQSLWASAVRGMSHGQRLYRDVWEQRPPGIYWIYLTGFRVFGWTAATVAWLDILAAAGTTLLLFGIARALSTTATGALAAALYASLTMPAWLYGYGGFLERSVCETFIVAAVACAAWSAVQLRTHGSVGSALALGVASGAAVVLKPNAGLYFPALLLWVALYARTPRRALTRPFIAAIVGGAILPLAALFWLWRLDLLQDARIAVVDFNRYYVGQGFTPLAYADVFAHAVFLRMKTDPLWAAGAVAAFVALWDLARRRVLAPLPGLGVIWGAAAALVMIANGARLFNSYFINPLPALALMAAWLLGDAWRQGAGRKALAAATGCFMALLLVQRGYAERVLGWARTDLDAWRGREPIAYLERFGGYANNRGYSARANAELADYVRQHTAPDDRIFLFGINGAGVYFASDRQTAHRFLRVNFFVDTDFPDPHFRLESVVAELAAVRPAYLIFERLNSASRMGQIADSLPDDPAVRTLLERYRLEARIEDFTLYRRLE